MGIKTNLVDVIWGDKRPPRPQEKVKLLPLEFTGKIFEEKIDDLRKELEKKKSAGLIVCMSALKRDSGLLLKTNASYAGRGCLAL